MNKNCCSPGRRSRAIQKVLIALTVAIIICLISVALALAIRNGRTDTEYDKDEILSNITAGYPEGAKNVTEALIEWDFPKFNTKNLFNVEAYYNTVYVKKDELPEKSILAKKVADLFLCEVWDNINVNDPDLVTEYLAACLIEAIGDKWGEYRNKNQQESFNADLSGELVGIGVIVSQSEEGIFVNSVIENSPAHKSGITANDIIVGVDGKRVLDIGYSNATSLIRGEIGTSVLITVLRNGSETTFSIIRDKVTEVTVYGEMKDGNIGYITITRFKNNTAEQFKEVLNYLTENGAKGIIFDLRSNPGGLLSAVTDILSLIAPTGTEIASFSNDKKAIYASQGTVLEPEDSIYTLPAVVLINEYTASAGELFTAAMRDFSKMGLLEVSIVGNTTYGKGVMQSTVSFPDGSALTLTTAYYNPPLRVNYDGVGIEPTRKIADGENIEEIAISEIEMLLR